MKKKHVSYWNHTLQQSRKVDFYYSIRKNSSPSAYLNSTRKNPKRRTLVKLRIGCHNLRVQTGRYDKIPLDERICPLCGGNKIEDETHLLLDCQRYSSMRECSFSKLKQTLMIFKNYRLKIWYHNCWIVVITITNFNYIKILESDWSSAALIEP